MVECNFIEESGEGDVVRQFMAQYVEHLFDFRRGDVLDVGFIAFLQLDAKCAANFCQGCFALFQAYRFRQYRVCKYRKHNAFAVGMPEKRALLGEGMGGSFGDVTHGCSFCFEIINT